MICIATNTKNESFVRARAMNRGEVQCKLKMLLFASLGESYGFERLPFKCKQCMQCMLEFRIDLRTVNQYSCIEHL